MTIYRFTMTNKIKLCTPEIINMATSLLCSGDVVAIPTETVYGLAANALSDEAVENIYKVKGRPSFNPLIIHFADFSDVAEFAILNNDAKILAEYFYPNSLTMVLNLKSINDASNRKISKIATAGLNTVAIRVPDSDIMRKIIKECGFPLAAPSANKSGKISPTSAIHVYDSLKDNVPLIIDGGNCNVGVESTIIDLSGNTPRILRHGKITKDEIENVIGKKVIDCVSDIKESERNPISPGQLLSHYAPSIKLRMNALEVKPNEALIAFGSNSPTGAKRTINISPDANLEEAARNLFSAMHSLDSNEYEAIAVSPIPETGIGLAINDRLKRASQP